MSMKSPMDCLNQVNLPEAFTTYLEQNYYSKITELSTLEVIVKDPNFLNEPLKHVALFSDHGISHGHDIANKIIRVLHQINGLLIPQRNSTRLTFMMGYGVILAYLHDIGLKNYTAFGRAIHPEFAAQLVFTQDFDFLIDLLWQQNSGNLAWNLLNLSIRGLLPQSPQVVLRELLSLSLCHSKSKVSIEMLNDLPKLRQTMQTAISTELHYLYHLQQVAAAEKQLKLAEKKQGYEGLKWYGVIDQAKMSVQAFKSNKAPEELLNQEVQRYYQNFDDSFAWLDSPYAEVQAFALDVIDTLRALRCADAFRERGATFKTSAGYEVFVNRNNAHAVYALRNRDRSSLLFLEGKDPISAGEANMTGADLDGEGNLRVSFACGSFPTPEAEQWAIHSAAVVINDIQADVIESFRRLEMPSDLPTPRRLEQDMKILIEDTVDNTNFAERVCEELCRLNPTLHDRIQPVVSLQGADLNEVKRYLNGTQPNWNLDKRQALLDRIAVTGHKVDSIDLEQAFKEVRVVQVEAGEMLIEQGSSSCFVYIPFAEGLHVLRSSSPASQPVSPWIQVGNIEVIRASIHHERVVVEQSLSLLMIPQEIYLRYWYSPYNVQEFKALCTNQALHSVLQPRGSLSKLADQILQETTWRSCVAEVLE